MKESRVDLSIVLAGGLAAFLLRLLQDRTGFEPDTGLRIAGNPFALALPVLLAALAVVFFLRFRRLPAQQAESRPAFRDHFSAADTTVATLMVAGLLAWSCAGALELAVGLTGSSVLTAAGQSSVFSSRLTALSGIAALLSAGALFILLRACRRGRREAAPAAFSPSLTLLPVGAMVFRLVLAYREDSVNPSLGAYYVELLALAALILCLYRVSGFAFRCGRSRRFALYAALTTVLSIATLADSRGITGRLFYLGAVLISVGLLLMHLNALSAQSTPRA